MPFTLKFVLSVYDYAILYVLNIFIRAKRNVYFLTEQWVCIPSRLTPDEEGLMSLKTT